MVSVYHKYRKCRAGFPALGLDLTVSALKEFSGGGPGYSHGEGELSCGAVSSLIYICLV